MIGIERRRDRRWWLLAGIAIGVVGLVIRLWLFQQPVNSDDTQYFSQAQQAHSLHELGDPTMSNGMRLVVVAVPAIYCKVFDSSFYAFYATVYTFAILAFAGVLAFAWVMGGPRVAVVTAALWATSVVAIGIDTRLTPDNIGTGLALIGLALIGWVGLPADDKAEARVRVVVPVAALGGFLLWLAFGARESFFVFGGVGVGFGLLSRRRWIVTGAVVGGLLAGFVLELAVMHAAFGDGLIRFKGAVAYQAAVAEVGSVDTGVSGGFSGYTLGDLVVRYPKLVIDASATEAVLHFVGLLGFIAWGLRWRDRRSLAKLGAGLAAYGFIAFGVASVDPIVPVMREKLRYYVTAAPLFYLAVAELLETGVVARVGGRFARWVDHRARPIAIAALGGVLILANLWIASGSREFARNGNDAAWLTAARLRSDAAARGRVQLLSTDGRTARVTSILMSRDGAWSSQELALALEPSGEQGYAYLDWKRLNANVSSGFQAAPLTHASYRLIEEFPLVSRAVRGTQVIDAYYLGATEPRVAATIDDAFPARWGVLCAGAKLSIPAVVGAQACDGTGDVLLFQGSGTPWRARGEVLAGDQFVEVVVQADAATTTTMRAYLYWWPSHATQAQRQSMGSVVLTPGARSYTLWTYLPQAAEGYRVVLRGKALQVTDLEVRLLGRHADDNVRPLGEAWPASPIRDRRLELVASAIRAVAGQDAVTVTSDALTTGTGQAQLPAWTWETIDPATTPSGFLIVDAARMTTPDSLLAQGAIVARSVEGDSVVDVVDLRAGAPSRERAALRLDFPAGWTRFRAGAKTTTPVGAVAAFEADDANDEYLYSSADVPWRAPDSGPIAAGRFVEVSGAVADDRGGGPLRVYLYWWPEGKSAKRITQVLGTVTTGADPRRFSLWTYLPDGAAAFRIGLRAGKGVTVTELSASSVSRVDSDRLTTFGAPW